MDEIVGLMATLMFLVMMRWKKIVIVTTIMLLLMIMMIIMIQVMIMLRMTRMIQLGDDGVFTPLPLALVLPSLPPPS